MLEVPVGAVVRVLADDPAAANDIPAWCRLRGQEYLGAATVDGAPAFDVRRAR
jgi:tRNA 2-thiouridine synthesizing protein A